jgi:membrane protein implicated in regulation of membrane protease activity
MDESPRRPQLWLIATAAILAVLMLYYYTGSWLAVLLLSAALAVLIAYQSKRSVRRPSHQCIRCGAKLNANARQCDSCGSASWTIH